MARVRSISRLATGIALILLASLGSRTADSAPLPTVTPQTAAPTSCSALIPSFRKAVDACSALNENFACYGQRKADSVAKGAPKEVLRFAKPRDREPIARFQTIRTLRDRNSIGVTVMRLHSRTDPEPVQAILFGDAQLQPQDAAGGQVYRLRANARNILCEAMSAGLAVSVDEGRTGRLTVNGVEIVLSSTAYLSQRSATEMKVANVEGGVTVSLPGQGEPVAVEPDQQVIVSYSGSTPTGISDAAPSDAAGSALLDWFATTGAPRIVNPNGEAVPEVPPCGGVIQIGQTVEQAISAPGQECIFTFCANAGDTITARVESLSDTLDPYVDLRAPDLARVKWNDDIGADNPNSLICNQPLVASSCDYSLVARAFNNASAGAFRLMLHRQTDCSVTPNCTSVGQLGVNLRSGPGLSYSVIAPLPPGAKLLRQGEAAGGWIPVQAQPLGQQGWVTASSSLVSCDDAAQPVVMPAVPAPQETAIAGPTSPPPTSPPATSTPTSNKGGPVPTP